MAKNAHVTPLLVGLRAQVTQCNNIKAQLVERAKKQEEDEKDKIATLATWLHSEEDEMKEKMSLLDAKGAYTYTDAEATILNLALTELYTEAGSCVYLC